MHFIKLGAYCIFFKNFKHKCVCFGWTLVKMYKENDKNCTICYLLQNKLELQLKTKLLQFFFREITIIINKPCVEDVQTYH